MEEWSIGILVDYYNNGSMLDVDVYQVGHHGSENATTQSLVDAITPEIAVVSVGKWNYSKTYGYGHPNRPVLDMLSVVIDGLRDNPVKVRAACGASNFHRCKIYEKIYATAWDGTVVIRADLDGNFRVVRNH